MSRKQSLTLVAQPQDFFRELIADAMGKQRVSTTPETEFYLVNLLNQFMQTDRLYPRDARGNFQDEPLALMLKDALEQPTENQQQKMFRHVGDVSLYMAGFFQDSLSRKMVDLSYYIGMGGTAYLEAARRCEEAIFQLLYRELAAKFSRFVEVLAAVSEKTTQPNEKDLLRLYERWMATRSERAEKALKKAGIFPNDTIKKKLQ